MGTPNYASHAERCIMKERERERERERGERERAVVCLTDVLDRLIHVVFLFLSPGLCVLSLSLSVSLSNTRHLPHLDLSMSNTTAIM